MPGICPHSFWKTGRICGQKVIQHHCFTNKFKAFIVNDSPRHWLLGILVLDISDLTLSTLSFTCQMSWFCRWVFLCGRKFPGSPHLFTLWERLPLKLLRGRHQAPCVFMGSQRWFIELGCSQASYPLLSSPPLRQSWKTFHTLPPPRPP